MDVDATVDDCELPTDSSLSEKLLALLALLLRSFLLVEPLLLLSVPTTTGLSKSKPNCSNERLKDVVLAGSVRCSCGGQFEDIVVRSKADDGGLEWWPVVVACGGQCGSRGKLPKSKVHRHLLAGHLQNSSPNNLNLISGATQRSWLYANDYVQGVKKCSYRYMKVE